MAPVIACPRCGFLLGFADEPARYAGPACPSCGEPLYPAARPARGRWFVVDRFGRPVAGPFASAESATRWVVAHRFWDHPRGPLDVVPADRRVAAPPRRAAVERERVPALIDAFDALLAVWTAQAMLDG